MSPDRPVPPSVQTEIAEQLSLAMGARLNDLTDTEQAEHRRQASVALDTLRALDPDQRAELLADLRHEDTWPELAPLAQITLREAVSLAYVATSVGATFPSLTNNQLWALADAALPLLAGASAGPVLHRTRTCVGSYRKCERGTCCWCGTDRPPTVTPFPLNDEPTRADECIAALRSWAEEERYTTTLAGHALTVLAELDRLRALVGGRSAAPTREQIDAKAIRWANQFARKASDAGTHFTEEGVLTLAESFADAVVALLSRPAEPPEGERTLAEARSLMRTARSLDPTKPASNELLGQVFGDLIDLLAPDGATAEPKEPGDD